VKSLLVRYDDRCKGKAGREYNISPRFAAGPISPARCAACQAPAPHPAPSTALQARLDYLFRHHVRDDPANAATHALRDCMENYRLAAALEAENRA